MLIAVGASPSLAQSDPLGLQFATVGSPNNPAYVAPNPNDFSNGRGGVSYEYRIGVTEVTTSQWVAFFNAAYNRPTSENIPFLATPTIWGAASAGANHWTVPAGREMWPVGGISWRTAAIFCNWLCKGANPNAPRADFLNGAYDVSTFGYNGNIFTDQAAHTPGAAYWIPTWDEWMKAAHWSPTNPNNGGWYQYGNSSDTPFTYGPPGTGTANAGSPSAPLFNLPLGSYPGVRSPWGLLDVAGEASEWTESIRELTSGEKGRIYEGSWWDQSMFQSGLVDQIRNRGGDEFPHVNGHENGLRIASAVPAPGTCALGAGVLLYVSGTRRRRQSCVGDNCSRSRLP